MKEKFLAGLFIFFLAAHTYAVPCEGWLIHLQKDHNVWLINKPSVSNTTFSYLPVPNSDFVVAVPKGQSDSWKVESKNAGKTIWIGNDHFSYAIDFDKDGKCTDTQGTAYWGFTDKKIDFNYDWKICEKIDSLFGKQLWPGSFSNGAPKQQQIVDALKAVNPSQKQALAEAVKSANSPPFNPPEPVTGKKLVENCLGQTRLLQGSVNEYVPTPATFRPAIK